MRTPDSSGSEPDFPQPWGGLTEVTDQHYEERLQSYWEELIREGLAAEFLDLSVRTIQGLRQKGGGPKFISLSARCLRYRRRDLRAWAESRLRKSTSDTGSEGEG
jgi:hypothetical protein